MFRPRIIPVLLLRDGMLVKSVRFARHRYIGDPLNAIRIFNEHQADELVLLDITATREGRSISPWLVEQLGEEADMPLSVGGGITNLRQIHDLIAAGAEKIVIGTAAQTHQGLVEEAAGAVGSSAVTVCVDVKNDWWGKEKVYVKNGKLPTPFSPAVVAQKMEHLGAGELIVQSISQDGMMNGYNIGLLQRIANITTLPLVALGGAGSLAQLREGYTKGGATGLAAGSLFIYKGNSKGVLINYPNSKNFLYEQ